jgi:hypothetical protein
MAFTQKRMTRQGTIPPDFEALDQYEADLDRKLMSQHPDAT